MLNSMFLTVFVTIIISITLLMMASLINKKKEMNMNKLSPFECGFNPMVSLRSNFSIQFFMIAILFLIFDIEIILILPFPIINMKIINTSISIFVTILILILGLITEWIFGTLEWF